MWFSLCIKKSDLVSIAQFKYKYFAKQVVHDGPIMDLKYDPEFGRLASIGSGFPQVTQLLGDDGSEWSLT
jgi:hypothetical protein